MKIEIKRDDEVLKEVREIQAGVPFHTIGDNDDLDANRKEAYDKLKALNTEYPKSESHLLLLASMDKNEIKYFKTHMKTYRARFPFYPGSEDQVVEREISVTSNFAPEIKTFFHTMAQTTHNQIHECRLVVVCHGKTYGHDLFGQNIHKCHLIIGSNIPGRGYDNIEVDDINNIIYHKFQEARKTNKKLSYVTVLHCCCHGHIHDKSINNLWFRVDTLASKDDEKPVFTPGRFYKLEEYVAQVTDERKIEVRTLDPHSELMDTHENN